MHQLSPSQVKFVESDASNIRLLAPAGSGKTYSLLQRARHLIERSNGTERVLILVFTVNAKNELEERIAKNPLFSDCKDNLTISTLNSWGNSRVKNILSNPRFVQTKFNKQELVLNHLRSEWVRDETMKKVFEGRQKKRHAELTVNGFDTLKSLGFHPDKISADEIEAHRDWLKSVQLYELLAQLEKELKSAKILHKTADISRFIRFWSKCVGALKTSGYYGYSDQLFLPWLDLEERLEKGQLARGVARYHHIFVDEFQDISALDANLLHCMREYHDATLTIVGDDDQAIYEWRAASVEFILRPDETFDLSFETIILEENYRSPQNIVLQAQRLIENNERRVQKVMIPQRSETATIRFLNQDSTAERITALFEYCCETLEKTPDARIALLSRQRAHLLPLQILCAEKELPFHAAEDLNVLFSESFKRLLRVLEMRDTITLPPSIMKRLGIDHTPAALLRQLVDSILRFALIKEHQNLLRAHMREVQRSDMETCLKHLATYKGMLGNVNNDDGVLAHHVSDVAREFLRAPTVVEALQVIATSFQGMQADYARSEDDVFHTDPPFEQLVEFSARYGDDFAGFYNALTDAQDMQEEFAKNGAPNARVFLMTALRAKGSEFDHVALLECTEGFWPDRRSTDGYRLEAERRLFYVAVTRCQKELVFSVDPDETTHSRFIHEFLGTTPAN